MLGDGLYTLGTWAEMLRRANRPFTSCWEIINARLPNLDHASRIPTSNISMGVLVSISLFRTSFGGDIQKFRSPPREDMALGISNSGEDK